MDDKFYYKRKGYVSNSSLNYLKKSPKLFKKFLDGLIEEEEKDYFKFGQLVHLKVLEPKEFEETVMVYDYETPKSAQQKAFIEEYSSYNKKDDYTIVICYKNNYSTKESDEKILDKAKSLYNQYIGYYKYLQIKDIKTIISSTDLDRIKQMEGACKQHKAANELLFDLPEPLCRPGEESYNEFEILWNYEEVPCKSLIDRVIIDHNNKTIKLVDFKTTSKLNSFVDSFETFGYDRQLVFYTMALKHHFKDLKDYTFEWYIEACDTKTFEVKSFKIDKTDLMTAWSEIEELLTRTKWHMDNDKWDYSMEYYLGDGNESLY